MAYCDFSVSFSTPLCAPKPSLKELQQRKAVVVGRISSFGTGRTATSALTLCNSNGDLSFVRQSFCCIFTSPLDHFGELFSCCMNVSSCTHRRLVGYWVGPDTDDEWGFVEAIINQST